jgi:hypothetical protein
MELSPVHLELGFNIDDTPHQLSDSHCPQALSATTPGYPGLFPKTLGPSQDETEPSPVARDHSDGCWLLHTMNSGPHTY